MKRPIVFTSVFLLLTFIGVGQDDISVYGDRRKEFDERHKTLDSLVRASEKQWERPRSGLPTRVKELSKEDKIKLTSPKEDLEKYSQFLKNRKAGIIKLLQSPNCNSRVIDVNDIKCLETPQIIGNGSLYSFSERSYVDVSSIDIKLTKERLSGWHPLSYALFSDLGDVSLETFDFSRDVKSIKKFVIAKDILQLAVQKKQFEGSVEIGGRLYKSSALVKTETIYLLRSGKYKFSEREFDEIIVAFRVIRKDNDGNVVLIWRKLS